MKKHTIKMLGIILFFLVSCNNYMDVVPDHLPTLEKAFTMRTQAEKYLFTCYSYLPKHGDIAQNPAHLAGDEYAITDRWLTGSTTRQAFYISLGKQTIGKVYMNYWDGANGGKPMYTAIRDCNEFMYRIDGTPDMEQAEKDRWKAEVEFLKAYYHYWLIRLYGPIVLVGDENMPIAEYEQSKLHRSTLNECFKYVIDKLDAVIESNKLPDVIENEMDELGRITNMIAIAFKAEVLLTQASPLFNGNTFYSGYTDNRGIEIFDPNVSEDVKKQRWIDARDAFKVAIDKAHSLGHQLYTYTPDYPNLNDATIAQLTSRMAMTDKWNKEIIWGDSNSRAGTDTDNDFQLQSYPRDLGPSIANTKQRGNHAVPMKIANQFYTKHGVPIDEDKTWEYANRFDLKVIGSDHAFYMKEGYTTAKINFDREIRYYASLAFDGCLWFGQGNTNDLKSEYVQAKMGQAAQSGGDLSVNLTGIWSKKAVHPRTVLGKASGYTPSAYAFPLIKLSSLYLGYAETLNETDASPNMIFEYVDKIRERAGLDGVIHSWTEYSKTPNKPATKDGRRKIIQDERLIELSFEGQRYWDLRRWLLAHQVISTPVTGWSRLEKTEAGYYQEQYVYTPSFKIRDYFTPFSSQELRRNPNIVQNYEW